MKLISIITGFVAKPIGKVTGFSARSKELPTVYLRKDHETGKYVVSIFDKKEISSGECYPYDGKVVGRKLGERCPNGITIGGIGNNNECLSQEELERIEKGYRSVHRGKPFE